MAKKQVLLKRTLAACTLLAGCDAALSERVVLGTLERDRIELIADTNEPIRSILVQEGQKVVAGEALLVQNTERIEAHLARARAEEATARAALAEAERGPRAQAIAQARARLEATRSARHTARSELDRQRSLVERNFTPRSALDTAQGRFDEAVAREEEAQAVLDELLEGTRNEKIDQARSSYAAAVAAVRNFEISLARATVRSPVNGTVDALPFEIGERPPTGAPTVVVLAERPTYARVHIPQPLRMGVHPGSEALVHLDGHAEPYAARVRWVSAEASFTPYFALTRHDRSRLSFVAEIDLSDGPEDGLPIGVPVEVTFPAL